VDTRTCWQLAEQAGDRTPHRMQRLLGEAVWDADTCAATWLTRGRPWAVLILDDIGDLKKGAATAPVMSIWRGGAGSRPSVGGLGRAGAHRSGARSGTRDGRDSFGGIVVAIRRRSSPARSARSSVPIVHWQFLRSVHLRSASIQNIAISILSEGRGDVAARSNCAVVGLERCGTVLPDSNSRWPAIYGQLSE
jgi:hypothetical protein